MAPSVPVKYDPQNKKWSTEPGIPCYIVCLPDTKDSVISKWLSMLLGPYQTILKIVTLQYLISNLFAVLTIL